METKQLIAQILNKAQKTQSVHPKCKEELKQIKEKDSKLFLSSILELIKPCLLYYKKEATIERVINFFTSFISSLDLEFAFKVIRNILPLSNAKDKAIRYRSCQIISGIINDLPDESNSDQNIWNELIENILPRLKDKIPLVKIYAISSLKRLQDPMEDQDEIIVEYFRLLSTDSNKKAVLQNLEISKVTLPKIIERIRDEKEDVRLLAFSLLQKVPMKKLLISQRVNIIKNGLLDRDEKVQEMSLKLCQIWLSQVESNVIKFLECLDVELYKDTCEILLDKLFESEKFVHIDHENLTPETIFYWRKKCEFLQKKGNEDGLDENLISISQFCDLLIKYQTTNVNEFIVKELLELSKYLDYCDEVGRKTMHALLGQMLIAFTLPELYVKEIIQSLLYVVPNPDELTSTIIRSIDELRKAADTNSKDQLTDEEKKEIEKKMKSISKQIKSLEKKKKDHVDDEEYEMAKKVKGEIEELQSQLDIHQEELKIIDTEAVSMWMRALITVYEFLKITRINVSHMLFLKDDLVLKNIKNENPEVQGASFSVLSQFCSLKKEISQSSIELFTKTLMESQQSVVHLNTLKGLFDIVLIHGFDSFENSNEIFESLERFLKSEDQDLKTLAVEGFCKLLICKKLEKEKRPIILSQLIILLHLPSTENDLKLRQCLTSFFPSYAYSYLENIQSIADSFVPTLRKIEQSKEKINSIHVCQFLIVHTDISNLKEKIEKDVTIHENLALQLSFELLINPKNHQYCKLLNSFTVKNEKEIQKILITISMIKKQISNKTALKSLEKFESNNKRNKENLKEIVEKEFQEHEKKYEESSSKTNVSKPVSKKGATKTKKMRTKKKEEVEEEYEDEVLLESPIKPKKKKKETEVEKLKKDIHKIVEKI